MDFPRAEHSSGGPHDGEQHPTVARLTSSLPEPVKAHIGSQPAAKGYGTVSEYFGFLLDQAYQAGEDARLEAFFARRHRGR